MKEVILVGRGESWVGCPFDAEAWGTMSCLITPGLEDKHFDKVFAFDPLDEELTKAKDIAIERKIPIVSVHPYATEPFPRDEVLNKIYPRGYLINSVCHMIALAILKGYERIRLYGIDQYKGMYLLQKGATEFWCGIAIGSCTERFTCPNYNKTQVEVAPASMLISEYLKQVANLVNPKDDKEMATFEVIPYKSGQPAIPFSADIITKELIPVKRRIKSYAFYDLEVAPATYDFMMFLVLAEKRRLELKADELRIVIVRGTDEYRRGDLTYYQKTGDYDREYMEWRVKNILIPSCWLMPSVKGVMVLDRDEAQLLIDHLKGFLYPEGYRVNNPIGKFLLLDMQKAGGELPSLKASKQARKYVKEWLSERAGNRKVVTINLRETDYESERNSSFKEWLRFYDSLNKNLYYPLFIRDMEKVHLKNKLNGYPEVVWNVELRQALYELSYLNLSVNSGTDTGMLFDKDVSCIIYKWLTPECGATSKRFFEANGLKFGDQLKHCTERQKIVWQPDFYEVIRSEFDKMVKIL